MLSGPAVTELPSALHARRSKPRGGEEGKALLKKRKLTLILSKNDTSVQKSLNKVIQNLVCF
jgi:hypothetical protein